MAGVQVARCRVFALLAERKDKVSVDLDVEIVARTRSALGARAESDAAVVERALNAYLLGRLLDRTHARSHLSEDEAERLAYEEVHTARRERGAA
jgi:hypothetical protein